jgi:glyoxylase-like metal-dependent hydrolase (beta-lactamase superfamily II)
LERPDVVTLTNGVFAENCYLVADPASREAVIVDPGEEAGLFLARLRSEGWTPRAVWLTHAHLDHIAGVAEVKAATGVPVLLHPADRTLYDAAPHQARMFGLEMAPAPPPDGPLADGDRLTVGRFAFEVIHVPGHSPGHVAFVGHGVALSGDVLFAGSIGRTDLPGGDTDTLLASIRNRLYALDNDTVVLPGHGPATTIAAEKRGNPFVRLQPGVNACLKCGAEVRPKPWGCKNPCPNCGFVYPLGDCSD